MGCFCRSDDITLQPADFPPTATLNMSSSKDVYLTPEGEVYEETWRDFPQYKPCWTQEDQARIDDLLLLPQRFKLARMKEIPFEVSKHTENVRRDKFKEQKDKDKGSEITEGKEEETKSSESDASAGTISHWLGPGFTKTATIRPRGSSVRCSSPFELLVIYTAMCAIFFLMALLPPFRKMIFREIVVKVVIDTIVAPILRGMCSLGDTFPVIRGILICLYNGFGFWVLAAGAFLLAKVAWESRKTFGSASYRPTRGMNASR